jgi:hypothetical protein
MLMNRRNFLPILSIPALSILPHVDALAEQKKGKNNDKAVIIIPLTGGPSQIDTFDVHEDAPVELQPFAGHIKTNVEGISLGSHFVEISKLMNRCSIINGISHRDASHDSGFHMAMTAYMTTASDFAPQKEPSFGSIISHSFGANGRGGIPTYVTSEKIRHTGPSWLGIKNESFAVTEEGVKNLNLNVSDERFSNRLGFINTIETANKIGNNPLMSGWSDLRGLASNVVRGNAAKSFKIDLESDKIKELYGIGKSNFGKNLLLARRLVQGGTKIVVVANHGWDTHVNLIDSFNSTATELDKYLSILILDLIDQGMEKDVLIVLTGEFGRTPRKNATNGNDHFPNSMSSLMFGGNFNHGKRVGLTTKDTSSSVGNPITHMDILDTIMTHLQVDKRIVITDSERRPHHILSGEHRCLL